MFTSYRNRILFAILIIVALIIYFTGLFVDAAGDAAKYAAIARNIFNSGDLINLSIHDLPYNQKPPFLFWLSSAGYMLFGINNFGFKFFPVLYSFFGIFCTYKLGQSLYSKKVGQIAAILIGFSEIYFLYNVDVHTDLVQLSNVVFSLWQLSEYLKKKKILNFTLAFFGIGLAVLTKGPIGAFIPAFAVIFVLLYRKEYKQLINPKWILGILITVLTISPALIGLYNQFGAEGIKFFFWTNNMGRITGTYTVNKSNDYFFYLHTLLYIYAPWSLLLFLSIFYDFKSLVKKQFKESDYFVFGGIWLFFIIISISKGKSPNYISNIMPLFTIVIAKWLTLFMPNPESKFIKIALIMQAIIVSLLWCCLLLFAGYLFPPGNIYIYILFSTGFLITLYIYIKMRGELLVHILFPSLIIISIFSFYVNYSALPDILKYQSSIAASKTFNERANEEAVLYNYDYEQFELYFYGRNKVILIDDSIKLANVCTKSNSWIFCYEKGLAEIKNLNTNIDTTFVFNHRGLYNLSFEFLMPSTRINSLEKTYLVKTK